jgi:hypothetical protein
MNYGCTRGTPLFRAQALSPVRITTSDVVFEEKMTVKIKGAEKQIPVWVFMIC